MSTTALFSEILVGGILALTWMVLVMLGIVDRESVDDWIGKNAVTMGVVFLAYSYALGVVFDRIWDMVTKPIDRRMRRKLNLSDEQINGLRKAIFQSGEGPQEFLEYNRSRMRIARAALCNAGLIGIAAAFSYTQSAAAPDARVAAFFVFIGLLGAFVSYVAFNKLLQSYYKQLMIYGASAESKAAKTANTR